jgi:hypothetical protein
LNIQNFSATGGVVFYDLKNNKRVDVIQNGVNYQLLVPNSGSEKQCFISSESNVIPISTISPVTSTAFFTDYSALAVDSAFVIVTHPQLMNDANLYKQYRSSVNGGLHHVLVANIDELYDQFAFGIVKSPLSIKRFAELLVDTYPTVPQNLFLIGTDDNIEFDNLVNNKYSIKINY